MTPEGIVVDMVYNTLMAGGIGSGGKQAVNEAVDETADSIGDSVRREVKSGGKSGSNGVCNPVDVVGKGSTGRTVPNTLNEQMAMHQVMSNPLEGAVDMSQLKNHPVIMVIKMVGI